MDFEEQTQIALYAWFMRQYAPYAKAWHHSPNGGLRQKAIAAKMKAMGTQRGFPDIAIYLPTREFSFLAIELKMSGQESPGIRRGVVSLDQKDWLARLQVCHARTEVGYGFEGARAIITEYMHDFFHYLNDPKGILHGNAKLN